MALTSSRFSSGALLWAKNLRNCWTSIPSGESQATHEAASAAGTLYMEEEAVAGRRVPARKGSVRWEREASSQPRERKDLGGEGGSDARR